MSEAIRTVAFTTLYPNSARPCHGIFIEQRLRHLLETGEVESRVVAPSAWFPFGSARFGRWSVFGRVPAREERYGIPIVHPRYLLLPKLGMSLAPLTIALAARPVLARLIREGFDFDAIDAHYLYPEGVAAVILGRWFRKPVVSSVFGDEVTVFPRFLLPRRMILWAVERSAGVTTVCQALKDCLVEMGVPAEKVRVILQGVDLDLFKPVDREAVRRRLGLTGRVLLSVGHLTKRKGHYLAIQALPELPGTTLLIAGEGWMERQLRDLVSSLGLEDRVRFLGRVNQEDLKDYYSAADALVLATSREGLANVLLESMACGTPVISTPLWGTPEAVTVPEAGVLMSDRSVGSLVEAVRRLFANYPDREATRRHAATFSWERASREHLEVLRAAVGRPQQDVVPAIAATSGSSRRA